MRILFLLIFLVSCGAFKQEEIKEYSVDPALVEYVNEFYAIHRSEGGDLPQDNLIVVLSDDFEGNTIGVCVSSYSEQRKTFKTIIKRTPVVKIRRDYWYDTNPDHPESNPQRQTLIDHELGHCLLHRGHVEVTSPYYSDVYDTEFSIPVSIMSPYIFSIETVENITKDGFTFSYYQRELHSLHSYAGESKFRSSSSMVVNEEGQDYSVVKSQSGKFGESSCVHIHIEKTVIE